MRSTLTLEPEFKSSGSVPERLLTIGEVAARAGVATSTVRYYERRGLLPADARESGQRRYKPETLRRLVFIGMLQDAGLALEDVEGILHAASAEEWKGIAARRLHDLDPYTYLVDVLQRVGQHPASQVAQLTPRQWKTHFAANPLRSDLQHG